MSLNLSQKERMLLEDHKKNEQICIQKYSNYVNQTQDEQLKQIFKSNEQQERSHLDSIHQLLNGTVPQMNRQQNQGAQQNMQANQGQNAPQNMQVGLSNPSDKDLCEDILMTEKYVSGTYDTAIFEFKDANARNVLNHIQKEEQQHGEAVFNYMQSKGMYNIQ